MPTRRQIGLLAATGLTLTATGVHPSRAQPALAAPSPVACAMPPGAGDCHVHVFQDPARFPRVQNRVHTPTPATVDDPRERHRLLRIDRVVLHSVSIYGTDNSPLLDGLRQPGFASLLEFVRAGKAYVKASAAHAVSQRGSDDRDVAPLARALIAANPDRILRGTNWPNPESAGRRPAQQVSPTLPIDDGAILHQLPAWAPAPAIRHRILVDNPSRPFRIG